MRAPQPRPSVGDQRHQRGGQVANDGAGALVQQSGRGPLLEAPLGTDPWQAAPHMGRLSDPSRSSDQGLSGQRGVLAAEIGAITLLYAPDLNPEEGIWKHLKYVELKNVCCQSLAELKIELRKAKERLRHKQDVILGCIRQPGFEV
jgi:hypothetical protein